MGEQLRQACLEMQLHLFSNGAKPAPAGFEDKMKAFLEQRANTSSPFPGEDSGSDDGGGAKRARSDEEEGGEQEEASKKPKPN